jgi:hypothetical protein
MRRADRRIAARPHHLLGLKQAKRGVPSPRWPSRLPWPGAPWRIAPIEAAGTSVDFQGGRCWRTPKVCLPGRWAPAWSCTHMREGACVELHALRTPPRLQERTCRPPHQPPRSCRCASAPRTSRTPQRLEQATENCPTRRRSRSGALPLCCTRTRTHARTHTHAHARARAHTLGRLLPRRGAVQESYGGEDAHFVSHVGGGAFGVADGVGGWQESGINPAGARAASVARLPASNANVQRRACQPSPA